MDDNHVYVQKNINKLKEVKMNYYEEIKDKLIDVKKY